MFQYLFIISLLLVLTPFLLSMCLIKMVMVGDVRSV